MSVFGTGLDIGFYIPGMPFAGDSLEMGEPLGGSETAGLEMARALASRGHRVAVFCNCPRPGVYDKVEYNHAGDASGAFGVGNTFATWAQAVDLDLLVVQRVPQAFAYHTRAKRHWLWCHDLASRQSGSIIEAAAWNIDKLLVVSKWMKEQYVKETGLPSDLIFATRNALNWNIIREVKKASVVRDEKLLLYAARPERGLDILLTLIFPEILREVPDARLAICSYAPIGGGPFTRLYQDLNTKIASFGDRVQNVGMLSKEQLYLLHRKASLYLYPTNFHEVSCISAMEAMALGDAFISTANGALPETVGNGGILFGPDDLGLSSEEAGMGHPSGFSCEIDSIARHPEYVKKFVETVKRLLTTEEGRVERKRIADMARDKASFFNWESVAQEWEGELETEFRAATSYKPRLARHFIKQGDIVAAMRVVEESDQDWPKDIVDAIEKRKHLFDEEKAKVYYDDISNSDPTIAYHAWNEARCDYMLQVLREQQGIKRILDVGCAHGGYAVRIAKEFPEREVLGIDISPRCIEAANGFKNMELPEDQRHRVKFEVGTLLNPDDLSEEEKGEKWDAVVLMEVLEHLPNPRRMLELAEKHLKHDGWVIFSVPFGADEVASERIQGIPGCHISGLDKHDLRDLAGHRRGFRIINLATGRNEVTGESKGCVFGFYQVSNNDKLLGHINWERKKLVQRPMQSISTLMITSNSDSMLRRALASVKPISDEIVVGDNASTDKTREMLGDYGARIIDGPNPLEVGFDAARNNVLENCDMDWVLWIDYDEQLLDWHNIFKYIRTNIFDGYSLRQHHFSAIPPNAFKADIPVRLFRLRAEDGSKTRAKWIGYVHEHPELGMNAGIGRSQVLADVDIGHDGYLSETIRRSRFHRNFKMVIEDRRRYPERKLGAFFELRDCTHVLGYALQNPAMLHEPTIRGYVESLNGIGQMGSGPLDKVVMRALQLAREHFISVRNIVTDEAMTYYSQVVQIWGQGFPVRIDLEAGPQIQPNGQPKIIWFASKDDLRAYMQSITELGMAQVASEYA